MIKPLQITPITFGLSIELESINKGNAVVAHNMDKNQFLCVNAREAKKIGDWFLTLANEIKRVTDEG